MPIHASQGLAQVGVPMCPSGGTVMSLASAAMPFAPNGVPGRPMLAMPYTGPTGPIPIPMQQLPAQSLGLQAPKGLPMPGPLQLPQLGAPPNLEMQRNMVPVEMQSDLVTKDKHLEQLSRYAVSLQQALQQERKRVTDAQSTPQVSRDPTAEMQRIFGETGTTALNCAALSADITNAAEIATQLNGWFVENAARMRTQDSWTSPAAYLETTTASLKQQMEEVLAQWSQVQTLLNPDAQDQSTSVVGSLSYAGTCPASGSTVPFLAAQAQTRPIYAQAVGGSISSTSGVSVTHPTSALVQPQHAASATPVQGQPLSQSGTPRPSHVPPVQGTTVSTYASPARGSYAATAFTSTPPQSHVPPVQTAPSYASSFVAPGFGVSAAAAPTIPAGIATSTGAQGQERTHTPRSSLRNNSAGGSVQMVQASDEAREREARDREARDRVVSAISDAASTVYTEPEIDAAPVGNPMYTSFQLTTSPYAPH